MDFSTYGSPSAQWQVFAAANPGEANDAATGNDPALASELRRRSTALREAAMAEMLAASDLPSKIDISTLRVLASRGHDIPIRRFVPKSSTSTPRRALVYFHGGGMLFGSETSDDFPCAKMASYLDVVVLSIIYRHTPEHTHPAQTDDAWDAFTHILAHAADLNISISPEAGLCVMGVSSGACLAASVILRNLQRVRATAGAKSSITGALLSIPWLLQVDNYPTQLFSAPEKSANVQCRDVPVLPWQRLRLFTDLLAAADPADRVLNVPLMEEKELQGWPRTGILAAGMDPLRDDGLLLAKKLEGIKVPTSVHIFPGLPHWFRRWEQLPASRVFDQRTMESLCWAFGIGSEGAGEGWHVYEE